MSLTLDFEPHSYYRGFAIKRVDTITGHKVGYEAYIDNGDTYRVDMVEAFTLKRLREHIRAYHYAQQQYRENRLYNGLDRIA